MTRRAVVALLATLLIHHSGFWLPTRLPAHMHRFHPPDLDNHHARYHPRYWRPS